MLGGWIVSRLMRVLRRHETVLSAQDDEAAARLGRVTSPIRPGGVGEIVYELRGARRSTPARAAADEAIERGTEVIVLERDHGVAVVAPWDRLVEADHRP